MKTAHNKAEKATETKPAPALHFRLEIIDETASMEVHGKIGSIISAIVAVMHSKPEVASLFISAAHQFIEINEIEVNPNTTK